jgi:hypothetical protein
MSALDDTRSFWIFTPEGCEHPIGVATHQPGWTRTKALREMYGSVKEANAAVDRGVRVRLVGADVFHRDYPVERLTAGCTCPR